MDLSKLLEKIKKCLALSKSSNEHEAAAALRQAQALMSQYKIEMSDVEMSTIAESTIAASVKRQPSMWEGRLMFGIAEAFGCQVIFCTRVMRRADWVFIGGSSEVEVAKYAADVLLRQAKSARKDYIDKQLSRCKTKTKTARADAFCFGWVHAACALLEKYDRHPAIEKYMAQKHSGLTDLTARDRSKMAGARGNDDAYCGYQAGKSAQLHDGVSAGPQRKMIGA